MPEKTSHSVIDSPEPVSLVNPPTQINKINKIHVDTNQLNIWFFVCIWDIVLGIYFVWKKK